ncbi:MAG: hypothetical protein QOF35_1648, partial [Actinomycetota bacterium]|nr:hypothetical protein [Actinomycetota bacterium]
MVVSKSAPHEVREGTPQGGTPELTRPGSFITGDWRRWLIRGAELVLLVFAVTLGGVSATSLFPTMVQTDHYRAEVRLSALPTFTSTIHSPTSFGDIDLEFAGPILAPGIDATVQARASI